MRLAVIAPGHADRDGDASAPAIDTDDDGVRRATAERRATSHRAEARATARTASTLQAATFTPKPKIYSRAQWGANERLRDKGSLHYFEVHAGFVHHTVNANDYIARRGAGDPPQHLRVPHPVPRLERRRLQLPGRPVRPDLGGPRRRRRPPGRRRAHPRLQRLRVRDVGDRQLRDRAPEQRDAPGVRRAVRLEAVAARRRRRLDQAGRRPGHFQAINGHRDAGSTACPGRYLYAKLPQIRRARREPPSRAGPAASSSPTSPRTRAPGPDRAPGQRRPGLHPPDRRPDRLRRARGHVDRRRGRTPSAVVGISRPHRRRHGDLVVPAPNGGGHGPPRRRRPGSAAAIKPTRGLRRPRPDHRGRRPDEDGRNDLVARNTATGRLNAYLGDGTGGFDPRRRSPASGAATTSSPPPATSTATATSTCWPGTGSGRLWLLRRDRHAHLRRAVKQVPGSWGRLDTITGFGDFTRDGRPDLVVRAPGGERLRAARSTATATFGRPLGPFARLAGLRRDHRRRQHRSATARPTSSPARASDLVTLPHNGHLRPRPPDRDRPDTSHRVNLVLNAGDWDRDGLRRPHLPRTSRRRPAPLRRGDGKGGFGSRDEARRRLRRRSGCSRPSAT